MNFIPRVTAFLLLSLALGLAFIVLPWPESFLRYLTIKNADYFLVEPPTIEPSYNGAQRLFLGLLDLKLQSLVASRFEMQAQASESDAAKAKELVTAVRDYTVTQTDLIKSVDPNRFLAGSAGKVALRGYGWCDQVNGVLGVVANRVFDNVELFGLYDKDNNKSPHALVRATTRSGTIFLDAWYGARAFGLSDQLLAPGEGILVYTPSVYEPDLLGMTEQFFRDGFAFNRYDNFYRLKKAVERMFVITFNNPVNPSPSSDLLIERATAEDISDRASIDLQRTYLNARFDHLLGYRDQALKGYVAVMNEGCEDTFCAAAKLFAKRLSSN